MAKLQEIYQVGKREDLRDIISLIDAKKYPLTTLADKGMGSPQNTLVEWQVDSYPAAAFDGHLETEDVVAHEDMAAQRKRLQTRIQIFQRSPMVGRLAEEVSNVAGIGKNGEMARSIRKSMEMIKRDIESAFGSDRESQAESGLSPYRGRGLGVWIQNGAQSDLPVDASYRTPAASINTTATATLTEADVNAVLASIWDQTGEDVIYQLIAGRSLRSKFSTFTQTQFGSTNVASAIRTLSQSAEAKKLTATIDVYEGDFGTIELIPSAFNAADNASTGVQRARGYLVRQDNIHLMYAVPLRRHPLPDLGGGPRELLWCAAAFCVQNPLGLGKFAATS
jgi:Family of unknown function (DUF5309)